MRKYIAACVLIVLVPLAASAATVEELQAQIQALLQQINALQQSLGQSSGTTASTATTASGGQCPLISRTLQNGSSGADVTRLQQFLARDPTIYPEALVTGYYGPLTEAAVRRFQCRNNIVCDGTPASTGYGLVGPRTAAVIAIQCPGGSGTGGGGIGGTVGGYMRVTPVSGNAPLHVNVEVHLNTTRSCTGATYELLYGTNAPPVTINVPAGNCNELVQTYSYSYQNPGTYTVTLRSGAHQSTATVQVGGVSAGERDDTFEVSPTSGESPLNVSFTGKANADASCSPPSYRISFGDNTEANIPVSNCSVSTYAVTHGYNNAGTYTARLLRGGSQVDTVSITVDAGPGSQGGGSFEVSAGYGGDAFAVLATFGLVSSCTAYDIDWGDGTAHASQAAGSCSAGQITKEVSHTYAGSGTYTITLKRGTGSSQTTDTAGVSIVY